MMCSLIIFMILYEVFDNSAMLNVSCIAACDSHNDVAFGVARSINDNNVRYKCVCEKNIFDMKIR